VLRRGIVSFPPFPLLTLSHFVCSAREKLVGWYHTGPRLRASDQEINDLMKQFIPRPVMVIVDPRSRDTGIPTDAYFAVEEIKDVSISAVTFV